MRVLSFLLFLPWQLASAECFWTGCVRGGCPSGFNQLDSGWNGCGLFDFYTNEYCCRPCTTTTWSDWGACDRSCGGGSQTHSRSIVTYPESRICPDALIETRSCTVRDCPSPSPSQRPSPSPSPATSPSPSPSPPTSQSPSPSPEHCVDMVPGWHDNEGDSCSIYEAKRYCKPGGLYGKGWDSSWGTFSDYAVGGIDATHACCFCQNPECVDPLPHWLDSEGEGCSTYRAEQYCRRTGGYGRGWDRDWGTFSDYAVDGVDATEACCGCWIPASPSSSPSPSHSPVSPSASPSPSPSPVSASPSASPSPSPVSASPSPSSSPSPGPYQCLVGQRLSLANYIILLEAGGQVQQCSHSDCLLLGTIDAFDGTSASITVSNGDEHSCPQKRSARITLTTIGSSSIIEQPVCFYDITIRVPECGDGPSGRRSDTQLAGHPTSSSSTAPWWVWAIMGVILIVLSVTGTVGLVICRRCSCSAKAASPARESNLGYEKGGSLDSPLPYGPLAMLSASPSKQASATLL